MALSTKSNPKFLEVVEVNESIVDNARTKLSKTFLYRFFLLFSLALAAAEPILVSFPPYGVVFTLQIAVLAVSLSLAY